MWWNFTKNGDQDRPEPGGLAERNIRARAEARAQDIARVKDEAGARRASRDQREAGAPLAAAAVAISAQPEHWPFYCERCRATGPADHRCIAVAPAPPRALETAYQAKDGKTRVPLGPYLSPAHRIPSQAELAYTPCGHRDPCAPCGAPAPASSLGSATPLLARRSASARGPPLPPAAAGTAGAASPWRAGDDPADEAEVAPWPPQRRTFPK